MTQILITPLFHNYRRFLVGSLMLSSKKKNINIIMLLHYFPCLYLQDLRDISE
jgi:hypothetical protein